MIELEDLTREFYKGKRRWFRKPADRLVALDRVNLTVQPGEVRGLLGPNGAGKTTMCKIIATVLLPTSGTVQVLGADLTTKAHEVRHRIGIVTGGERGLYYRLSPRQFLRYWGSLYGLSTRDANFRGDELLEQVGLRERANDRIETLSRGMKQRLHLARGLVARPEVLLLDEPTAGMDPVAAHEFRDFIRDIRAGHTVLLTTHDMVEAEQLCNQVTLIDNGQVIATEPPRELGRWITRHERVDVTGAPQALLDEIATLPGVSRVAPGSAGETRIETAAEGAVQVVLQRLVAAGVTNIATSLPDLEEVYLRVFGRQESAG